MCSVFKKVLRFIFFSNNKIKKDAVKEKFDVSVQEGNSFLSSTPSILQGRLVVKGKRNIIRFGKDVKLNAFITIEGDDNVLEVFDNAVLRGRVIIKGKKQKIIIGSHSTFQSAYLLSQEGCDIQIGDWCMFSRDIEIRTTDAHSVVDVITYERVNQPSSVKIGNHVWVGVGSLISKGAAIPNDSIVGAHSFVNKQFTEENVLIAGTPAKVVRQGVTWNRGRKPKFSKAQLEHWKEPPSKTE